MRALAVIVVAACHAPPTDRSTATPAVAISNTVHADAPTIKFPHRLIKAGDPDVVAEWSSTVAQISIDGGRSFERVIDDSGQVRDVAFDEYGRMVIVVDSLPAGHDQILGEVQVGDGSMTYVVNTKRK